MNKRAKRLCAPVCALLCAGLLAACGGQDAPDNVADFDYSAAFTENGSWKNIDPADYVTLADYGSLVLPADVTTPDPAEVQSYIDGILADFGTPVEVTDRAVQQGDTVRIDYIGSVNGIPFDGGNTNGQGTSVTIGVTKYIDDFLDQLVGHMPGETVNVEVTFPDDYGVAELNGKDAVFVTEIHYIEETSVPELTDEFVQKNLSADYGVATVEELRAMVGEKLVKDAALAYVRQWLTDNSTVSEIPAEVLAYEEGALLSSYNMYAQQYGMDLDTFLSNFFGLDREALLAREKQVSENNAKYYLIIEQVAVQENVAVSDEDLVAFFLHNTGSADYNEYVAFYGEPYVRWVARVSATEDLLVARLLAE